MNSIGDRPRFPAKPDADFDAISPPQSCWTNDFVKPHLEYRRLGKTAEERQTAYRQLFKSHIPEGIVTEIREAANKAWVLGNDRFKHRMQKKLERRVVPTAKGGDRKSEQFRSNRV